MKGIVFTLRRKTSEKSMPVFAPKYFFKRYGVYFLLFVFMVAGLIFGFLFSENTVFANIFNGFFGLDVCTMAEADFLGVFAAHLCASFILLFVIFIFGVCAAGTLIIPFAAAVKGIGMGTAVAVLAADFRFKGILFYLLTCLPGDIIFIIALMNESRRALSLSLKLAEMLFFNKAEGSYVGDDIKYFVVHSSYMLILTVGAALVNTLLRFVFAGISGVI